MQEVSAPVAVFGLQPKASNADSFSDFFRRLPCWVDYVFEASFATALQAIGVELPPLSRVVTAPPVDSLLAINLGGDGTFLRCAQWVADSRIPVLGVNSGHLGYLSAFTLAEAEAVGRVISELAAGSACSLQREERELLCVEANGIPDGFWPYALNEVAIIKEDTGSMINARTDINGFYLTDYLGDGLVVSTPTGSTGYNLALGGPILQPTLHSWILSPIAPHTLTMRPLVVGSDSCMEIITESRSAHYRVSLDGRSFLLPSGSSLRMRRAPFPIITLRRSADNFASTLRNKLFWGHDNRYPDGSGISPE